MAIKTKEIFKSWRETEQKYGKKELITNISNIMEVFNGKFTDEDKQYLYEERAAIMEYDGGLSRSEAEKKALEEVVSVYNDTL